MAQSLSPAHDNESVTANRNGEPTKLIVMICCLMVIFIGPRCTWGPIYGSGCLKLSTRAFADLTDVTLDVNHPVNLVVKFRTNASSAIWWQNLQPLQVGLSGGQLCN